MHSLNDTVRGIIEEKNKILSRYDSGEAHTKIVADTNVPKSTFYNWLSNYKKEQESTKKSVNMPPSQNIFSTITCSFRTRLRLNVVNSPLSSSIG